VKERFSFLVIERLYRFGLKNIKKNLIDKISDEKNDNFKLFFM